MSNERAVRLTWEGGGHRFTGQGTDPASPAIRIDGDSATGPSPMLTLLLAAGSCSGADVVSILEKMRVTLAGLTVEVRGTRREDDPRRYVAIRYRFTIQSPDAREEQAERAVALSLEKYCSVVHTLAPDVAVSHEVVLAR